MKSASGDTDAVCKAVASGYFYHAARLSSSGEYKTAKHAHTVFIHPSSCLSRAEVPPRWVLYHELAFTTKEYMRSVTPIKPDWLLEIAPHYYQQGDIEKESTKKVKAPGR